MRTKGTAHDETRQRLLKTARTLVLKGGHENLSLREIAREAGFSPASLYEYFDGKDAIVETLAAHAAASLRLALERATKGAEADRADRSTLVRLGLAYVAWAKAHPEDFLLLFNRLPSKRTSTAAPPPLDSPFRVVLDAVARVRSAKAPKAGREESSERLAYALWAAAHGMAMLQLTHLSTFEADFETADRAALEALVKGWIG